MGREVIDLLNPMSALYMRPGEVITVTSADGQPVRWLVESADVASGTVTVRSLTWRVHMRLWMAHNAVATFIVAMLIASLLALWLRGWPT
jgi:hypothetical protein